MDKKFILIICVLLVIIIGSLIILTGKGQSAREQNKTQNTQSTKTSPSVSAMNASPTQGIPQTSDISITATGFSPVNATMSINNVVKFTNNDTKNHDVIGSNGFDSGPLSKGMVYYYKFPQKGIYTYYDKMNPTWKGQINVK